MKHFFPAKLRPTQEELYSRRAVDIIFFQPDNRKLVDRISPNRVIKIFYQILYKYTIAEQIIIFTIVMREKTVNITSKVGGKQIEE